jgi:hypothetical protein
LLRGLPMILGMNRALAGLGLGAVVVAAGFGSTGFASPEQAPPSRVVDRTVVCDVGLQGGVYVLNFHAASPRRAQSRTANVEIRTSVVPTWRLAGVGQTSVELSPACRRSAARVPLSAQGLTGFTPSGFGDEYDCWTPRRVLLRVRAVFTAPVRLKAGSPWGFPMLFARGKVREASFAVRTEKGKALAVATVAGSGRVRVHIADGDCFRD